MSQQYRIAVVDTETTGLYPSHDHLIEIGIMLLEVDAGTGALVRHLDSYQGLDDPGRPIPAIATAIHGITDAMVRGHRIDRARVVDLLTGADLVVAHNSGFDKGFVRQIVPGADALLWACSCRGIPWRRLYPTLDNTRLQHLAARLQVPCGAAHRALGDVETTVNLVLRSDPAGTVHLLHLLKKLTASGGRNGSRSGAAFRI